MTEDLYVEPVPEQFAEKYTFQYDPNVDDQKQLYYLRKQIIKVNREDGATARQAKDFADRYAFVIYEASKGKS